MGVRVTNYFEASFAGQVSFKPHLIHDDAHELQV